MPDPWKRLQELLARRGQAVSSGEQYIRDLPGVGPGLLDTLRALHGEPLAFDTVRTDPFVYGQYRNNRVSLNPGAVPRPNDPNYSPVVTLVHEVIGHGIEKVSPANHQEIADDFGRAFIRLTRRDPELPYRSAHDMYAMGRMKELLDQLKGPRDSTVSKPLAKRKGP